MLVPVPINALGPDAFRESRTVTGTAEGVKAGPSTGEAAWGEAGSVVWDSGFSAVPWQPSSLTSVPRPQRPDALSGEAPSGSGRGPGEDGTTGTQKEAATADAKTQERVVPIRVRGVAQAARNEAEVIWDIQSQVYVETVQRTRLFPAAGGPSPGEARDSRPTPPAWLDPEGGVPPYVQVTIEDLKARAGEPATFRTVIEGNPQPTVACAVSESAFPVTSRLLQDNDLLTDSARALQKKEGLVYTLTLSGVTPQDSGVYTCLARNSGGEVACKAELLVHGGEKTGGPPGEPGPGAGQQSSRRKLHSFYEVQEEIGRGAFGFVRRVTHKGNGVACAAKFLPLRSRTRDQAYRERAVLAPLDHPRITRLLDDFETKKTLVLILELCCTEELLDRLFQKNVVTEAEVKVYIKQILEGLRYLHANAVLHLDIKPPNILMVHPGREDLKICDFGLAQKVTGPEPQYSQFGAPEFVSPEIVAQNPVSAASDIWAVGAIAYLSLTCTSPFAGESDRATLLNVRQGKISWAGPSAAHLSPAAKDFLRGIFRLVPRERPDAAQCIAHPWFAENVPAEEARFIDTKQLKFTVARSRWQRSLMSYKSVLVMRSIPELLQGAPDSPSLGVSRHLVREDSRSTGSSLSDDELAGYARAGEPPASPGRPSPRGGPLRASPSLPEEQAGAPEATAGEGAAGPAGRAAEGAEAGEHGGPRPLPSGCVPRGSVIQSTFFSEAGESPERDSRRHLERARQSLLRGRYSQGTLRGLREPLLEHLEMEAEEAGGGDGRRGAGGQAGALTKAPSFESALRLPGPPSLGPGRSRSLDDHEPRTAGPFPGTDGRREGGSPAAKPPLPGASPSREARGDPRPQAASGSGRAGGRAESNPFLSPGEGPREGARPLTPTPAAPEGSRTDRPRDRFSPEPRDGGAPRAAETPAGPGAEPWREERTGLLRGPGLYGSARPEGGLFMASIPEDSGDEAPGGSNPLPGPTAGAAGSRAAVRPGERPEGPRKRANPFLPGVLRSSPPQSGSAPSAAPTGDASDSKKPRPSVTGEAGSSLPGATAPPGSPGSSSEHGHSESGAEATRGEAAARTDPRWPPVLRAAWGSRRPSAALGGYVPWVAEARAAQVTFGGAALGAGLGGSGEFASWEDLGRGSEVSLVHITDLSGLAPAGSSPASGDTESLDISEVDPAYLKLSDLYDIKYLPFEFLIYRRVPRAAAGEGPEDEGAEPDPWETGPAAPRAPPRPAGPESAEASEAETAGEESGAVGGPEPAERRKRRRPSPPGLLGCPGWYGPLDEDEDEDGAPGAGPGLKEKVKASVAHISRILRGRRGAGPEGEAESRRKRGLAPLGLSGLKSQDRAPSFVKELGDETVVLGQSVTLTCQVSARPAAQAHWFKDGTPVPTGGRVLISSTLKNFQLLTILVVGPEDLGVYTCSVSNALGSASSTGVVRQAEIPGAPPRPDVGEVQERGVLLVWKPAESHPPVTYIVQCRAQGGEWTALASDISDCCYQAGGLSPGVAYAFRTACVSKAGMGPYSGATDEVLIGESDWLGEARPRGRGGGTPPGPS
ncbi:obscurin-like [Ornithorhynchus anatinus]|uniref:obscurin-like n=1 Tax=Ornithorhynchus anatinus TaxID=9258 RepID=UPI0019D489C3|nr:obscurin-like [Ornithorhynchus anatinus]